MSDKEKRKARVTPPDEVASTIQTAEGTKTAQCEVEQPD
jgi:hypothetical protein